MLHSSMTKQPSPLRNLSGHPLSKIKIVKTLGLERRDLEYAVKKMKKSIDVSNVLNMG